MPTSPPTLPTAPPEVDAQRRALLAGALMGVGPAPAAAAAANAAPLKTLRLMFNSAETTFDPARIVDLYSRTVTAHIFESLYSYDPLARPARVMPVLADMDQFGRAFADDVHAEQTTIFQRHQHLQQPLA